MPRFALRLSLATLLLSGLACGARQNTGGQRVDRNVITQAQIREKGYRNALEAVEGLRAPWLITRPDGLGQQREVQAYLDDSRLGGVPNLRQITASQIVLIRYIDAPTAINRWGVDHGQGAIVVITRN